MKFVSYLNKNQEEEVGLFVRERVASLAQNGAALSRKLPATMAELLNGGAALLDEARHVEEALLSGKVDIFEEEGSFQLIAPVPHPPSCRDAYAFRQHVATARRNRGVEMIPEFDQFPVFYFTNHNAIIGPGELVVEEDHLQKLDFELEAAAVIGRRGRNVPVREADAYVVGYTIMNDFSARLLQMEEMRLNLGPAKGKDFATALGPWLVTADELEPYRVQTPAGDKYNLAMKAWHNGKQISEGNMNQMDWTFAEIIERCAYGADILPGDVIGSGTVGTGCYLELNGTWKLEAKERGEEFTPIWLQEGDTIELEIEALGRLSHTIVRAPESRSLLALKKNV